MRRFSLRLNHVQAARELRAGEAPASVGGKLGISKQNMNKICRLYASVPDPLLASIERLLNERDQLRHIISKLTPAR